MFARFMLVAGLAAQAPIAGVAPADVRFQPVETSVERGVGFTVKVCIFDTAPNLPVPDVEIRDPHVHRSPDGLPNAVLPAFFAPSLDYGIYSLRTDFLTDGNWVLTSTARIPGQAQPIAASMNFVAVSPKPVVSIGTRAPAASQPLKTSASPN